MTTLIVFDQYRPWDADECFSGVHVKYIVKVSPLAQYSEMFCPVVDYEFVLHNKT